MFFFLRMVVWLAVVFALLPADGAKPNGVIVACGQAGLTMLHDVFRTARRNAQAPQTTAGTRSPAAKPSQGTLTAADLAPPWRGPRAELHRKNGA